MKFILRFALFIFAARLASDEIGHLLIDTKGSEVPAALFEIKVLLAYMIH